MPSIFQAIAIVAFIHLVGQVRCSAEYSVFDFLCKNTSCSGGYGCKIVSQCTQKKRKFFELFKSIQLPKKRSCTKGHLEIILRENFQFYRHNFLETICYMAFLALNLNIEQTEARIEIKKTRMSSFQKAPLDLILATTVPWPYASDGILLDTNLGTFFSLKY
jgi:hypothetical protein